jgi:hypothetical protein
MPIHPISSFRGSRAVSARLLACLFAVSACVTMQDPTEVVVEVRADRSVREAIQTLQIEVWSARADPACSAERCWTRRIARDISASSLS